MEQQLQMALRISGGHGQKGGPRGASQGFRGPPTKLRPFADDHPGELMIMNFFGALSKGPLLLVPLKAAVQAPDTCLQNT